ncbi:MAG TPA: SIS domain-containing protein [Candidatus Limnocylindrales bacterium]|nr:SIS domain-containing protein [Candidatus Limnocylindrales bacterium]
MSGMNEKPAQGSIQGYFQQLAQLIPELPYESIEQIAAAILQAFDEERTVFVFGNGGSAASASHMMCDMNKGTIDPERSRRLKVMALTDNVPLMTAWANDSHYERIFAEQLRNFAQPRDVAFAISGSGNSPNVLHALTAARERGAVTVGLAGYQGGKMKPLCDFCAVVPSDNMQMIEDMHHAMLHAMFTVVRDRIHSGSRQVLAAGAGRLKK